MRLRTRGRGLLTVNKVNLLKKACSIALLGLCIQAVSAANITQVNRYATVENKALTAQINPLLSIQQVHFPQKIQTVGEALTHWMQYSGYALVDEQAQSPALKDILSRPLPQVVRNLGPLTVHDGLEVLVGPQVFSLTQDPLRRQINFKLKPQFAMAQTRYQGKKA